MRHLVTAVLLFLPALGFAEESFDCTNAPKEAVIDLPAPINEWATIICTPYGHVLTNKRDRAFVSTQTRRRMNFPAQITNAAVEKDEHGYYFVSMELKKPEGTGAFITDLYLQKIFQDMGQDVEPGKPVTYDLTLVTNKGIKVAVFFWVYEESMYGSSCWESCLPVKGFVVLKRPEPSP